MVVFPMYLSPELFLPILNQIIKIFGTHGSTKQSDHWYQRVCTDQRVTVRRQDGELQPLVTELWWSTRLQVSSASSVCSEHSEESTGSSTFVTTVPENRAQHRMILGTESTQHIGSKWMWWFFSVDKWTAFPCSEVIQCMQVQVQTDRGGWKEKE